MPSYIFDIETNAIEDWRNLSDLRVIHCLVLQDIETGEVFRCNNGQDGKKWIRSVSIGVGMLMEADLIVGQNVIRFDITAIQKLYPWFSPRGEVRDTKVATQLIWPSDILKAKDYVLAARGKLPKELIGKYSLEAWGHRIGEYKGAKQDFSKWTQELEDYCVQDVEVTRKLWQIICSKNYSPLAMWLEHSVAALMWDQERFGAPFDEKDAASLYAELVQVRTDLEAECKKLFAPWWNQGVKPTVPKRDIAYKRKLPRRNEWKFNKRGGIVAGAAYTNLKLVEFNPGSRHHIADRLMKVRGWKPEEFTAKGEVEVNEKIMARLRYPEAKPLMRFLLVDKRISQLAEGKQALLKCAKDGRIHGEVQPNHAATRRASHIRPNLAQVPKVKAIKDTDGAKKTLMGEAGGWGYEMRDLFRVPLPGWKLVGSDASGLELRMLGHYMHRWDGGAYAKQVIEGDVHSLTMGALEIDSRDTAKTWKYAWLYGAGDGKLGAILKKGVQAGKAARAKFLRYIPALGKLVDAVKLKHRTVKHLVSLDKGIVFTRSEHAALNTLLQSAGAIVCKLWIVFTHRALLRRGFKPGRDYQHVLWVHDEQQILAREEIADEVGKIAVEAIREVGEFLGLKVPLDGEYKVGNSWAETH